MMNLERSAVRGVELKPQPEMTVMDEFLTEEMVRDEAEKPKRGRKRKENEGEENQINQISFDDQSTDDASQIHKSRESSIVEANDTDKLKADKYISRRGKNKPLSEVHLTRVQWAGRINKFWGETHDAAVQGIFLVGENLIAARNQLSPGDWENMLANDLNIHLRTVQRLIAVASHPRLRSEISPRLLPSSWGTLYQLTRLTDSELDKLVNDGILRPEMERKEVDAVRKGLRLESKTGKLADHAPILEAPVATAPEPSLEHLSLHDALETIVEMIEGYRAQSPETRVPADTLLYEVMTLAQQALE